MSLEAPTPKWVNEHGNFRLYRRGNKGFAKGERYHWLDPIFSGVHMGYAWQFRCDEYPRLTFTDHIMAPHDCPEWRTWEVDGEVVKDLEAACRALALPPLLTLAEYVVLERIGEFPVDHDRAIDMAAGAVNPTPNFRDGRWSKCSRVIDSLIGKGILKHVEGQLVIA